MGKPRTSLSPSDYCANCESSFAPKDSAIHEQSCPPPDKKWSHSYIRRGVIHSTLECYTSQVQPQHISEQETDNMIFMSLPAMTVCNIAIGDPVVIDTANGVKIVKTVWPTNDKTLTSVSMTRKGMDCSRLEGLIKVRKLSSEPQMAREIEIKYTGKQQTLPKTTAELEVMIKNRNELNIFVPGNRITVPYYGKNLNFEIVRINDDQKPVASKPQEQDISDKFNEISISEEKCAAETERFYKALYCTKWRVMFGTEETKSLNTETNMTIDDIGGYETVISELRDFLDVALGKWRKIKGFKVAKGILLYGTAGVGKSMIANAVLSEYSAKIFALDSSDFQKKIAGETETRLSKILEEAKSEAPSVIFIEDIDVLCPRKSNSAADNDKRSGYSALVKLLDEIRLYDANIVVLATTSRPDYIDSSLRRPGRLDKELEVCAPTPAMRKEIIRKFLAKVPNRLTDDDVDVIASTTHGFVGADLYGLCSDSALRSMKRFHENETSGRGTFVDNHEDITIELQDFNEALKSAKPSAMKEVVVEVPNVKWSEIGGQEGLKLKLKQAVEWPLRHPEAFTRLGISPPRGLLMFGPPGCSKTMIAKALATESKLNFLNIKGPELFSKWVGDSERAVRQVFRKARQVAPSIIFIDEIDALGGERGSASNGSGGSNVQERVLAQLLTELDGVTALGNVTLVAATNRPDRIDKALLRPGRLDRIVYVPLPDAETRREIFTIKFQKMPQAEDVNIQDLVDLTEGYSGAEVQAICHEAAMKALEENLHANIITKEHFKAALSIVTPRTPASLIKMYDDYINNYK